MSYWRDKPTAARNIRLLHPRGRWLAWDDRKEGDIERAGAKRDVEARLLAALNSTNLLLLLGSGASLAATNPDKQGKSAPRMSDLWDCTRQRVGDDAFDGVVEEVYDASKGDDVEALLSLCKMRIEFEEVGKKKNGDFLQKLKTFVKQAEEAILERVNFVQETTDLFAHKELLRKLAMRSAAKPRTKIFTTNYDRCIEEAATIRGLMMIDGFTHSTTQRFNRDIFDYDFVRRSQKSVKVDFVDGVMHLYKLHGSLDWRRRISDGVIVRSDINNDKYEPVLIYPRSSKYQEAFSPPYLDMFAAWQSALREQDTTLIVSGFGFADDHISAPVWSALESNLSLRLIICDPCFIREQNLEEVELIDDQHEIVGADADLRPYQKKIVNLVNEGDRRITILNGRFGDLALAMPEIVGETDRQGLQARLDRIREGGDGGV